MNIAARIRVLLAVVVAAAATSQAPAAEPCKNHDILRPQCGPEDPGLRWERLADPPMNDLSRHAATLLQDGRVLVIGGAYVTFDARGARQMRHAGAYTLDPASGAWTPTLPMNDERFGQTAVRLLDGRVLVLGGYRGLVPEPPMAAEIFDPGTNAWTPTTSPLAFRLGFTATLLPNGRVLLAGGVDSHNPSLASAELYDPVSETWRFTGSLREARCCHTATSLPDGRVLVVGGMTDEFFEYTTGTAEIYDPALETWSAAGEIERRWMHATTAAGNGEVVVTGGYRSEPPGGRGSTGWYVSEDIASTAIFDPATATWRDAEPLAFPRYRHHAVPAPGHGMVVIGGITGVAPSPRYRVAAVPRIERLGSDDRWRLVDSYDAPPASAFSFHSATALPDGSALFLGDTPGAQAMRLRFGP